MSIFNSGVAQVTLLAAEVTNPLEGVKPDIGVFGDPFKSKTNLILSGLWGVAILACVAGMLWGGAKWGVSKYSSHDPDALTSGAKRFKSAALALAVVAAMYLVVGAILKVAA